MRTLFADLYPVRKLLIDHKLLLQPKGFSEAVVMDVSVSQHLYPRRATPHLWGGMISQAKGDYAAAISQYNTSAALAEPYDWQPSYRMWRLLLKMGDEAAAAIERGKLLARWGEAQLDWYATDVDGAVVPCGCSDVAEELAEVDAS